MAASRNSTVLPRRTLLAGAAAALVAAPAMKALSASACAGDPIFAAKKREAVAAWAKLNALYAEQELRLKALGGFPKLPERLREPMLLPKQGTKVLENAPDRGWDAEHLARLADTGLAVTYETTQTPLGGTIRVGRKPITAKTRRQAAELLKIRLAHDAAHKGFCEKMHAIEEESAVPLAEAIDLAFALMAYPVSTLAEVRDKIALAQEWGLFSLAENHEYKTLQRDLLRDALAAAEKAVAHA